MKLLMLSLVSILAISVLSCGKGAAVPQQTPSEFASRIGRVLPNGWSVQETGERVIVISRGAPVRLFTCVAFDLSLLNDEDRFKQYIARNSDEATYRIKIHRAAKIEPAEYSQINASNEQIAVTKSTEIYARDFYPDDAMLSSDSRYRQAPEYYDDSSSIYVETTVHPYECIYPRSVAEECDSVRDSLDSLFNRYSSDSRQKKLTFGRW